MSHCKAHQDRKLAWPKLKRVSGSVLIGMLGIAGLAAAPAQAQLSVSTIQRTSAFEYAATNGLLIKEITEPGDSTLCVVNLYEYDGFGNRKKATTRNCNGAIGNAAPTNSEAAAPATGDLALFATYGSSTDYGASGQFPLITTNALGQSETKSFDARFGVIASLIGPNALTTRWAYDDFGRRVLEERADGTGTRWRYEYCEGVSVNGTAGTSACPTIAGAVGAYVITIVSVKNPSAANNTDGGALGPYSKTYYDSMGRPLRFETQGFDGALGGGSMVAPTIYQDIEYDSRGQVARKSRPYAVGAAKVYWISYTYDTLGRVIQENAADSSISKITYAGLTTTTTNARNQSRSEVRNEAGQLVTITDAAGKTLTRSYDAVGNMVKTIDALGNVTQLAYDLKGRKIQTVDPDMGRWDYSYNALGELVKQTDAKAQVTTMSYDVLGRMTAKQEPSLNAYWYYDTYKDGTVCTKGIGKLCEASANNGYGRKHSYDSLGRVISTATTIGSAVYTSAVSYVADAAGPDYQRIKDITYPSGLKLAYVYTPLGSVQKVVAASNANLVYWRQDSADAEGHILQYTYGNNVVTLNTFSPDTGRLKTQQAGTGGSSYVQDASYAYDMLGNLKRQSDAASSQTSIYSYDNLNRLTSEIRTGTGLSTGTPTYIGWTYDDIGNITSRSDVGTYIYPTSGVSSVRPHAVTGITGTVNGLASPTYFYDANGNITYTKVGAGIYGFVTWTSFNKVNALLSKPATASGAPTPPSTTLSYLYDAEGERVQETVRRSGTTPRVTVYLNPGAGAGLYYEEDTLPTTTKKKHYISAGGGTIGVLILDTATNTWSTQYWHKDQLGSTIAVSDAMGAVTERMAYEAFGKRRMVDGTTDLLGTLVPVTTNRGFTGHQMMDEAGLINMNGRIYNPAIGRFLSADPSVPYPTDLQSYNRYSYVHNNPLANYDPSGYTGCSLADYPGLYNGSGSLSCGGGNGIPAIATGAGQTVCDNQGRCGTTTSCQNSANTANGSCTFQYCTLTSSVASSGCLAYGSGAVPYQNPNWKAPAPAPAPVPGGGGQREPIDGFKRVVVVKAQLVLTTASLVPVLNIPSSILNAVLDVYLGQSPILSLASIIPVAGIFADIKKEAQIVEALSVDAAKGGLAEARAARDALAAELAPLKGKAPATVTGGYNVNTGEVAARACGGGKCAENHVVDALGGVNGDVRFTEAMRPRTGAQVPVCPRCEATFGRGPFPSNTRFRSDE